MPEDNRERLLAELMGPNPRGVLHRLSGNAMEALLAGRSYDPLGLQSSDSDVSSEGSDEHSYLTLLVQMAVVSTPRWACDKP